MCRILHEKTRKDGQKIKASYLLLKGINDTITGACGQMAEKNRWNKDVAVR